MGNLSCAFFGHSDFDYSPYREILKETIIDLIENKGVTEFYSGGRGKFEGMCAHLVWELRKTYPQINNILVLSYMPTKNFELFLYFNESVYLLEKSVPPKYAISHTNRQLVKLVDYVVSGVIRKFGGAKTACDYAKRLHKPTVNVVTGDLYFFDSFPSEEYTTKVLAEHQERLRTDEEYRKAEEKKIKRLCEIVIPKIEAQAQKHKKQRFRK